MGTEAVQSIIGKEDLVNMSMCYLLAACQLVKSRINKEAILYIHHDKIAKLHIGQKGVALQEGKHNLKTYNSCGV